MATVIDTLVAQIVFKGDTKALDNVNQRLKQFSTNLNAMGRQFGLAGGSITAFSGLSLKTFSSFDDALNQSLAIMGDVSDAMRKDMAQAAKDVAVSTRFSAKDAAESYFFLASAGLDAKQSIEALPQVAQFAQAGMFDMAQATDLLTDAQSALGLTIRDDVTANMQNMVRVSDTLVKANTLANATVQQFSEALTNRAGAALRALGKDVEEGVAVLAAYADQGEKGQRAGEQLNIVLRDLQKAALDNRAAFDRAGVTVFDASGEMTNLADIVGNLESRLAALSDEEKRTALTTLGFQERSLSSLITLLGTSDAIRDYEAALRSASGTTALIAGKQLESLAARFDLMKSQVEATMIGIGAAISPLVEVLFGPLTGALNWVNGLFESNNWFVRIASQGVAILGGGFLALSVILFGTALAVRGYAVALNSLKIPHMIATMWNSNFVVGLRLAAITLRTKTIPTLTAFAAAISSRVSPALTALWGRVTAASGAMLRFATTIWTSSVAALRTLATRLAMAGATMLRFSGRAIVAGIAGVVAFASTIWAAAVPALAAFAAGVWATTVALLANPIGLIIVAIAGLIAGLVALVIHWDTVKRVVKDFFDRFGNYILAALAVVAPFIGVPLLIAKNWGRIVEIVGGIWSRVNDTVRGWIEAIIAFITELPGRVLGVVKDIPGMVAEAIRDIPGLGGAIEVVAGAAGKAREVLRFAQGGVVPGPVGRPVLSLVHGGEMVLPPASAGALSQLLEGFRLGPAALPTAPAGAATIYRSSVTNQSTTVEINGPITINTQATTAREIAQQLGQEIQDQVRNIAFDHDGPVDR